ncbi:MAG: hypothetical protein IJY01_03735 [Clostridia bacterium]|nr:hypothetical protein [Clostridia bacterium]
MSRKSGPFVGADDVYLTEKSIAIRRVYSYKDRFGKNRLSDTTEYIPKTQKNLQKASRLFGKLRFGRK